MNSELYQLKEHLFKLLEDSNLGPRYIFDTSDEDGDCYTLLYLGDYNADIDVFTDMMVPSIKKHHTTHFAEIPIKNKESIDEIIEKMVEFIKGADKI
jgi:predicted alpha/beta superfamily hydrolase